MTNDSAHCFFRDTVDNFVHGGGKLFDEVPNKLRNISFPFTERRQRKWENIQPIVQILSEFAVTDHLPQVSIDRRDDTNIVPRTTCSAPSHVLPFPEPTQNPVFYLQ